MSTAAPDTASGASTSTVGTTTSSRLCDQTEWKIIVGVSLGAYFAFLIVIALAKFACAPVTHTKEDEDNERRRLLKSSHKGALSTKLHLQCMGLMKGANIVGRIMLIIYSFCVVTSFVLYVRLTYYFFDYEAVSSRKTLLNCFTSNMVPIVHADIGINIFYALVFIVRIIASNSLLNFWLSMDTMADHVTLIPSLIMYIMNKHIIAFQYARLVGLRFLVNTLIYCNIVRGEKYIRLLNLLIQIISVWLISAGFFQLIEGVGDFWLNEGLTSASFIAFHDCFYYLLITMSTVGYGDFSPRTVLGKFFIIFFVIVALGMFTRIIPEISEILTESKKYKRNRVHLKHGKSHVVVIGNFTVSMLNTFFNDFYHEERSDNREFVALLGEDEPNLELKAVMKTRELYVTYLQGNVMSVKDLHRTEVKYASAVIIMSDQLAKDQEDEDMKNIMRVIAIKDYCPQVKILVQLQLYRSKTYLRNVPDWGQRYGDQSVCINEIKYGILAQSCIVPGISTLLCNLLMLRSCSSVVVPRNSWSATYLQGVEFEFYKVPFAPDFAGLNFLEACRICYQQLGIVMLAVEESPLSTNDATDDSVDSEVPSSRRTIINPGASLIINPASMEAFVIAKDLFDAKKFAN